jgi:ABC-type transport system involved in multi-copper enzyme maturation permease subunit
MMLLWSAWATFCYECRRAFGPGRLVLVAALALFPPALIGLIQFQGAHLDQNRGPWAVTLFILIPEVVCLLGLLLWATPVIQSEIEGKTWTYLAVRPGGKVPILLGKYAAALVWTLGTALVSLTLTLLVLSPPEGFFQPWGVFARLILLSCVTYAALYALLGVVFLRRAMGVAVAYTFLFEFLGGFIPAMVNQLTVQYHLRSLLFDWLDITDAPRRVREMFGTGPAWEHVLGLGLMSLALLTLASLILRRRELVTTPDA